MTTETISADNSKQLHETHIRFGIRDFITLLILPLMFAAGYLISLFPQSSNIALSTTLRFALQVAAVVAAVALNNEVLKDAWREYRKSLWLKIIISLLGMLALHAILYVVRLLLPAAPPTDSSTTNSVDVGSVSAALIIFMALTPTLAPFLEELVFRHTLFYKFRTNTVLLVLFFFISSALFGLIHLMNFNGNVVQTIPYMIVGACLSLTYLFTKNIWYPIGIHFVFNIANSLIPALFLIIMQGSLF
jgi:membrane protease YdiL (CAAX protease family)